MELKGAPITMPSTKSKQDERIAGQASYGMSNLRPERTGLPFIVFISQKDDARHSAHVKVSPAPKVVQSGMGSYPVDPFGYKAGERLPAREEKLLERWVELNRDTLQQYWDGDIAYTEDALALLRGV